MSNIAITITDGWAFRWLFTSGLYSRLDRDLRVSLYVNDFYMQKLQCMGLENVYLLPKASSKFILLNSIINESYRNNKNLEIQKYYLSKYSIHKRIVSGLSKWHFFSRICAILYSKVLLNECASFDKNLNMSHVDRVIFLSPYLPSELVLAAFCDERIDKVFVLPSWDNIYKYSLNSRYNSYIVWGFAQKVFLENEFGVRTDKIKVLGSITQYVFNGITKSHSPSHEYVLYCTIGKRLFPQERKFVGDLARLFALGVFGRKRLMIRLHPADNIELYQGLESASCSVSAIRGVQTLHNWDVDQDFFARYYSELSNACLIINVASTVTLDSLMLNQNVVNYNPIDYDIPFDYYSFEHYAPLKDVVYCCQTFSEICEFIKDDKIGRLKNMSTVINLEVSADINSYFNSIISD